MYNRFLDWFMEESRNAKSASSYFNSFIEFLIREDFRIIRSSMGTRTVHPQVETVSYLWAPNDRLSIFDNIAGDLEVSSRVFTFGIGSLKEIRFKQGTSRTEPFKLSPIYRILQSKKTYVFSFLDYQEEPLPFPILEDLKEHKATGYIAIPAIEAGNPVAFKSFVTDHPEGFTPEKVAFLEKASNVMYVKWSNFMRAEFTETLLSVYLGKRTGSLVYSGKVHLGDVENMNSVIWFSDIRNYSGLSEDLSPSDIIHMLNDYFGAIIPSIEKNGGEVLKMLGDGILAVFPFDEKNKKRVRMKALLSVRQVFDELRKLNRIRIKDSKTPIRHGVGLHKGQILYGNIGSRDRLDFTVIGEAVNLASRIAGMCGELKKAVLASEEFVSDMNIRWEDIGEHKLKGIAVPKRIFAISEEVKRM
ncbi:adenylate/guanylate cyclase domain-containing protein [Leptospira ilyithenensis]|uniref:Adenylate/guanylate cyclase domain-containing protein n=1 Tax=Leptospira ilyithenensis TaxID=2484901 RepID=A0A4R9LSF2_9LEPT|nr:adenylate/guanylate cyclase domain-containing protein [Leptospira ilyithenensis]TGN14324.1 adenylate/guanylate cyclase domain-containing protein [Leptospira ilyithenensis]